ncbi:methyltransferase domain-containing protein [Pseudomonas citronellolis]|uniref:methyltransferase domain-containing protein n=1 Tax=Pseudomonas citronellolis TaxID=53408 RepID=UPI0026494600|nr:methyltransferase domain-containing protein [Pseudomonas citronellolis]MDN6875426.1 methyltransferase domain-containing protein [Pseudomonas citronellolis]
MNITANPAEQRLSMFQELLQESTRSLLRQAGLYQGMRVLELGCGNGSMTLWLAEQVGPEGQVIAVDQSSSALAILQERAERAGLNNIVYRSLDLDQGIPDSRDVDLVHGRFLLMHLKQSVSTLSLLFAGMREGSILALEEPVISIFRSPEDRALWAYCVNLYQRFCRARHIDPDYGVHLLDHVNQAGFCIEEAALHFASMPMNEAMRYMSLSLRASGYHYVYTGLATRRELDTQITRLETRTPSDSRVTHFHPVSQLIAHR